jgi:hypothetical protein
MIEQSVESATARADQPSPPEAPAALPPAAPAPPAVPARPRPNWLWYTSVLVALVVTLGALGLLFIDDGNWQQRTHQLEKQNTALTNQKHDLFDQVLVTQADLTQAKQQVTSLQAELKHPTVGIWNVQQKIDGASWYLAGGVPDTFTYHLKATSSGPMSVSILTFEQFAAAIECVDGGSGNTNYCMHHSRAGTVNTWANVTSVNFDFHLAEGCANYMVVFTAAAPVTVTPDVSVTYNPASKFTGDCS